MIFKSFEDLIKHVQNNKSRKRVAVVAAQDEHTLKAVFKAKQNNIVDPILIGNMAKIKEILRDIKEEPDDSVIVEVENDAAAAEKAVEFVHHNKADFIMKGKIQTADILKAVVNKEKGLGIGNVMSHFVFNEVPNYHKLLVTTDGGMMMYPNLDEKRQIIENTVNTLLTMGYENPKVAVLAAVEKVNIKMPESVQADLLKKMNQKGEIQNCTVEGPISYDLAVSKKSAELKGYVSPVAGDADILIAPNITAGNILGKCLLCSADAKMAGFIVGAKVPIVLTSRGSSAEEKYLSLVLSASAVK
ncbi:bifunctional enoyl-CoA hydratase/phosphate acetyltransferase [Clostridium fermenticellae]|uniref:Bifunctional enoyl-CoA hydratase/phosphate acetyltransferase n=1 Tax=Clostridium fermenticellae TaxID=2068654 RepID=A0A386H132_9CLOT|nr:bifunctional enoyl-CoA hydratase/phosphate acetyltransferase [Clostridium fermenticellae]AYD39407.1 bifunctional enoyl-CoA hydratase/phosphate acetyltransferase [Clostridium fermenticellae]